MLSIRTPRLAIALCLLFCIVPATGLGFSIAEVAVVPPGTLVSSDNIGLVVGITTPSQDAFLFAPTVVQQNGNLFTVDIYIDDGRILPATDFLEETITLGMLAAGDYSYLIRLSTGYDVNFGVRELTGGFSVVPLPPALLLLLGGIVSLTGFRKSCATGTG